MKRLLLQHERKAVELLLESSDECALPVPTAVTDIYLSESTNSANSLEINAPFTIHFDRPNPSAKLERIASCLCIPDTFGSLLFLVQDKNAQRIEFLELMPDADTETSDIAPYLRNVLQFLFSVPVEKVSGTLVESIEKLRQATNKRSKSILKQMRLWSINGHLCFYFSNGVELLLGPPVSSTEFSTERGNVALHQAADGSIALDGWFRE
jgi:hypothetical protein